MEQNDVLNTDRLMALRPLNMDLADDAWKAKEQQRAHSLRYFDFLVAVSQFLGFLMLVLSGYYFSVVDRGFQWGAEGVNVTDEDALRPRIGFGNGEALLSYRLHRHEPKWMVSCVHGAFHFGAVILVVFAMIAIVNHKDLSPIPLRHMYSIHSWIGVGIIAVYIIQLGVGFLAFFFPKLSRDLRRQFLPVQRTVGLIVFSASIAQVLLGNQNYQSIQSSAVMKYWQCATKLDCADHSFLIQNFSMLAVVFYGISVVVLIVNPQWRRWATPDEKEA
ncbi:hypothetical protein QR680_005615 [Steinernema hermaphroditum]|uniref:Cytochrome b561 domain-containing protein n=1 Tax=Steinernema hermaphroditum TaxID=289476 RepID=A0AA39LV75_9BILA|nr:hypothetical protein QR680_005615 [Steinernema hermaphroditum]